MERNALCNLLNWNQHPKRKPMIVWGARQVGKTHLIRDIFATTYYKYSYLYIDCKADDEVREFCSKTANAGKIIEYLSLYKGQSIDSSTLYIL